MPNPTHGSPAPAPGNGTSANSFESMIESLEQIIERIEGGEVGLEQSIAEYEKGMALIKRCREVLTKAEQRVEELGREGTKEGTRD